jgi:hypothetical protein
MRAVRGGERVRREHEIAVVLAARAAARAARRQAIDDDAVDDLALPLLRQGRRGADHGRDGRAAGDAEHLEERPARRRGVGAGLDRVHCPSYARARGRMQPRQASSAAATPSARISSVRI